MKYTILALSPICCFIPTIAHAQPIIPNQDGTGTIVNQQGNQFNIQGGSHSRNNTNLFHSFQEFNLHQGQIANFISDPNIENILGRINGGNPSIIHGLIQVIGGNSNLFLMNPAGIIFGANASLNLPASFHVSTATGIGFNHNHWFQFIGNNDYQNLVGTPNQFVFSNNQPGTIINQGNLSLNTGKNLSLLGGSVINIGELSVPAGNITMAAIPGENIVKISQAGHLLSLEFLPLVNSQLPEVQAVSLPQLLTGNGSNNQANIIKINEFGQLVLGNTGIGINDINQTAINTGKIDVSQSNSGHGGQVNIIGEKVGLINSEINASGYNQGGTVLIGGDFQGRGIVPNAVQTYVDQNSLINANVINNGNGGKVIIWSDDRTTFYGSITARGGINNGNGGLVEISGKKQLIFDGKVDVSAVHGLPGIVLFDPDNLTLEPSDSQDNLVANSDGNITNDTDSQSSEPISQSEATNFTKSDNSENTDNKNVTNETDTETDSAQVIDLFEPDKSNNVTVNSDNVNKLDVDKLDVSGNIELQADNDLTVNQAIATDKSLKLVAGRSININADIDTSKGNGDIGIFANNSEVDPTKRQMGPANILQAENTVLNAGAGDIIVEMGSLGEVGEIKLGNLTTQGVIAIQGAGANIYQVSANSLFQADKIILETSDSGGIGKSDLPLRINVHNLEAETGSGGIFLRAIAPLTIGDVTDGLNGIKTYDGGEINLNVNGDLTATENILNYLNGEAENTQLIGDISITATGNIKTGDINMLTGNRDVGNISIESTKGSIDTTSGDIRIFSEQGNTGNISIVGNRNVRVKNIRLGSKEGNTGFINIKSEQGSIDTTDGSIMNFSDNGDVGNISILANNNISTGNIYLSTDNGNTGFIDIKSEQGFIDTTNGTIIIVADKGNIGDFSILANDDIKIEGIVIKAMEGNISNVNIESTQGIIDVSSGFITINAKNAEDVNININVTDEYQNNISISTKIPTPTPTPEPTPTPTPYETDLINSIENKLPDSSAGNVPTPAPTPREIPITEVVEFKKNATDNYFNNKENILNAEGDLNPSNGNPSVGNQKPVNENNNAGNTPTPEPISEPVISKAAPTIEKAESKKNVADDNLNTNDNILNTEGDINPSNGVKTDTKSNVTVVGINNTENIQGNVKPVDINNIQPGNIDINPIPEGVIKTLPATNTNIPVERVLTPITNTPQTQPNTVANIQPVLPPLANLPPSLPNTAGNIQPAINNIDPPVNIDRGNVNQNPVNTSRGSINTVPNNSNIQTHPPVLSPVFNIPQEQTNPNPITIPQSPINPIPQVGNNLPPNQNIKINNPSPVTINPNTITDPSNINTAIPRSENSNIVLTPTNLSQLNNQDENLLDNQLGQSSQTINNPLKIVSNSQSLEEENIKIILRNIEQETGTKATLIDIRSYLDSLQLVLYTANGQPVFKTIPVTRQQLLQLADNFRNINNLSQNINTKYLTEAQRLYQLLIQPIEDVLDANQTNTLLFSLDEGLGNFPIADLYDGQNFLAQKYRIIPYSIR